MRALWNRVKGWVMAVTAFVACPCHLPLTLPLVLSLTAGTALGAWLARSTVLIYTLATVSFLGGLALAHRWLAGGATGAASPRSAPADVVLVTSDLCQTCEEADWIWQDLRERYPFRYRKVSIHSGKGRSLAATHNILITPTTLIDGRVAFRGVPDRLQAGMAVRRWEGQGVGNPSS